MYGYSCFHVTQISCRTCSYFVDLVTNFWLSHVRSDCSQLFLTLPYIFYQIEASDRSIGQATIQEEGDPLTQFKAAFLQYCQGNFVSSAVSFICVLWCFKINHSFISCVNIFYGIYLGHNWTRNTRVCWNLSTGRVSITQHRTCCSLFWNNNTKSKATLYRD